jgi:hypothetical protein
MPFRPVLVGGSCRTRGWARGTDRVHLVTVLGSSELFPVSGARDRESRTLSLAAGSARSGVEYLYQLHFTSSIRVGS